MSVPEKTAEIPLSVTPIQFGPQGLELSIADKERYFNYHWLRDACPTSIDPQTRERVFDIAALPTQPSPAAAWVLDDTLVIDWAQEAHVTRLPLPWLQSLFAGNRLPDPAALLKRPWYAKHAQRIPRFPVDKVLCNPAAKAHFVRTLIEEGIALVTGMEDSDAALTALVESIGPVTHTAEGGYFDVRTEADPTNLAFTSGALEMHTDLPGEMTPPGVQFLHCRANSVEGGFSLFVDGVTVAETLRAENPDAFMLLSNHKIPFFYRHDGWDYRAYQRVIDVDEDGRVAGVTVSQHLQDTLDLEQSLLDSYYPAYCQFLRLLQEARFMCRFRLNAGECVVFDNQRVVHGRESFLASSGKRHLRGCYTNRGALKSTFRVLVRDGFERDWHGPDLRGDVTSGQVGLEDQTIHQKG